MGSTAHGNGQLSDPLRKYHSLKRPPSQVTVTCGALKKLVTSVPCPLVYAQFTWTCWYLKKSHNSIKQKTMRTKGDLKR